eukprot:11175194-Lingulodinium_polyedra.AAC.1
MAHLRLADRMSSNSGRGQRPDARLPRPKLGALRGTWGGSGAGRWPPPAVPRCTAVPRCRSVATAGRPRCDVPLDEDSKCPGAWP